MPHVFRNRLKVASTVFVIALIATGSIGAPGRLHAQQDASRQVTRDEALAALDQAIEFYRNKVATHGGYVWRYSSDLEHRQGEAVTSLDEIWIQPPGTPSVGMAYLSAFDATKNHDYLEAALETAEALLKTQLHSGGWGYGGTFAEEDRRKIHYRMEPSRGEPNQKLPEGSPGGWAVWKQRKLSQNLTVLDDDTTFAAIRFLIKVDEATEFQNERVHEAVLFSLDSLMKAQYPIGAWSHNYDRYPERQADVNYYPVKQASFPESWSRTWDKLYSGCYELNDRISVSGFDTMLLAYDVYGEKKYLNSALRAGEFFLLAQMPDPQPAWAQQYDRDVHPVWSRKFEPPAITGSESQDVIELLMECFLRTDDKRFLTAARRAVDYLKSVELEDGRLARFYELRTSKPLYFTTQYELTYDPSDLPDHYSFIVGSKVDRLERELVRLEQGEEARSGSRANRKSLEPRVRKLVQDLDARGAWTSDGWVRDSSGKKVVPENGIIESEVFVRNVELLSRWISLHDEE